jgi:hypothetical protein
MENTNLPEGGDNEAKVIHVDGMFKNWFLDYASYVILSVLYRPLKMV